MSRKQCKACPWRKDVVPDRDIPNGYCETKHHGLKATIATGFNLGEPLRVMACHESALGKEIVCVGWLANQLQNNNLAARLAVIRGRLSADFELVGEQHERFEDTLPGGDHGDA